MYGNPSAPSGEVAIENCPFLLHTIDSIVLLIHSTRVSDHSNHEIGPRTTWSRAVVGCTRLHAPTLLYYHSTGIVETERARRHAARRRARSEAAAAASWWWEGPRARSGWCEWRGEWVGAVAVRWGCGAVCTGRACLAGAAGSGWRGGCRRRTGAADRIARCHRRSFAAVAVRCCRLHCVSVPRASVTRGRQADTYGGGFDRHLTTTRSMESSARAPTG